MRRLLGLGALGMAAFLLLTALLFGCTSLGLRQQLDDQLSEGDRFSVEIVAFDREARTARVRLIDQGTFADARGQPTVLAYRYDGTNWVRAAR